jgi:3-hydroxypropanoate dehydrogenase
MRAPLRAGRSARSRREIVESAFELACLGPTSGNCQPLPLVLVRSPAAKERLLPSVSSGNYEKVRTAPITADRRLRHRIFRASARLYPHNDAHGWFTSNTTFAEETAFRNSSLQGAYFILALRLDCGPMSGFDAAKVDVAFFLDGRHRTNFLLNIGYGDRETPRPRLARPGFDEVPLGMTRRRR